MSMIEVPPGSASASAAAPPPPRRLPGWAIFVVGVAGVVGVLTLSAAMTGHSALTSAATMRNAVVLGLPILLAGLGGLWAERAGVVNIGLEGMMILGTWGAAWGGINGGPWLAVVTGAVFGGLGGLLHAAATVSFGVNHIVSGVAINLLGAGVTKYLSTLVFEPLSANPRQSPSIERFDTFSAQPFGDWLGRLEAQDRVLLSDLAGMVRALITGVSPMLVISVALVVGSYLVLWRTRFGLRLRSCGESPVAAESLGVNVYLHKYVAVTMSGVFAGLGGAALVLGSSPSNYSEGQTNGRGFIGLAAMIFGNWRPGGLVAGAGLFGYADGLRLSAGPATVHALLYGAALAALLVAGWRVYQRRWFAASLAGGAALGVYLVYLVTEELPREFLPYTPHLITLVVLGLAAQRLRMPAAVGLTYRRGNQE